MIDHIPVVSFLNMSGPFFADMFIHQSRVTYTWLILSLLFQLSHTQLTGYLQSSDNPYIITLQISNPSENTISVLPWNNIFDNATQLPVSFTVTDYQYTVRYPQGLEVPLASTYAMRAGVSNSDLYSMEPGQNFTRVFDVRQFLQTIPSGPTGSYPKAISLYLPSSLKGVIGTVAIAPEAAASLNSQPPKLGDFASAGLTDITLTANPLELSLRFPIYQSLDSSFAAASDGIQLNSDCKSRNATNMSNALFDAGIYARAVNLAASSGSDGFYTRFFSNQSSQNVSSIAGAATRSIHGGGPHVDLYCSDIENICGDPNILGYTFAPSWLGNAYIVLCPSALALGRAPEPCSALQPETQISASSSHVMFHLLLTLNNVVNSIISNSVYGSLACSQLVNSTSDPTSNADSFAQLAIAQWAYGLGGAPYDGPSCVPASGVLPDNQKRAEDSIKVAAPQRITVAVDTSLTRRLEIYDATVIGRCTGAEMDILQLAGANARSLATYALNEINSGSNELWTTSADPFLASNHLLTGLRFFNGDSAVKAQVKVAFEAISVW